MENYKNSDNPASMLADYADYMTKYADAMEQIDQIDEDELTSAEYAYYVDTMARIQKKLLEVSQ